MQLNVVWSLFIIEHILIILKGFIGEVMPDVPTWVRHARMRGLP